MARLNFSNEGLKRLVEISDQATEYKCSYGQAIKQYEAATGRTYVFGGTDIPAMYYKTTTPSLWLVKDTGIYLMSSAVVERPKGFDYSSAVVYATGYDPRAGDVWEKCRKAVGGDDFVEAFELTGEIKKAIAAGWGIVIDFTPDFFEVTLVKMSKVKA